MDSATDTFMPLQDRSLSHDREDWPTNRTATGRMNSFDTLQMPATESTLNMRGEDGIKNRPLHELLNYDDDDRIMPRTQFEMDTNLDKLNQMSMSMSTLGIASVYGDGAGVSMKNRFGNRPLLFALSSCLLICLIAIVTVALIIMGPQLDGFHTSHGATNNEHVPVHGKDAEMERLRAISTVEHLKYGAVASDHPICSSLGHHILNVDNGNVVDAAVATALCLGIANPASSGLGGGMFMVIHIDQDAKDELVNKRGIPAFEDLRGTDIMVDENGKTTLVIDAREVAPSYAHKDMFENLPNAASTMGGLAMAVPGELKGLELAHTMFGKLSWADVLDPAIKLARDGIPVSGYLASSILHHAGERWAYGPLRKLLSKNGEGLNPLQARDIMKNEALADFLESARIEGSGALYYGSHTAGFLGDVKKMGSILTEEDLKNYKATIRTPLVAKDVFGHTIVGVPPPSSGGATVIGAARFLSGYHHEDHLLKFLRIKDRPPKLHRLTEAMRHAFAIRMSLSDPAFDTDKVNEAVNDLVYNDYMESLRKETPDHVTLPLSQYGGGKWAQIKNDAPVNGTAADAGEGDRRRLRHFGYLEDKGTTSFSVMDTKGNGVSVTSSINTYFGSGILSPSTGILLNSQMDDFATPSRPNYFGLEPTESNYIQPGKKPLSSMSPTLVFEPTEDASTPLSLGDLFLALGGSGGPKIISATLQTFLNHAVAKMDLFHAVASPRIHDQLLYHSKASTLYESSIVGDIQIELDQHGRFELESTGHSLVPVSYAGCVQVVSRSKSLQKLTAVSDPRKGGRPAGL